MSGHDLVPSWEGQHPDITGIRSLISVSNALAEVTLSSARPALERSQLFTGRPEDPPGGLWVVVPEHFEICQAAVETNYPFDGSVSYRKPRERYHTSSPMDFDLNSLWATTREELEAKIADRKAHEETKSAFVAEHPLRAGALVIANEYGGIDFTKPEETAHHLLLRAAIGRAARLRMKERDNDDATDFTEAGLLHPLLERTIGLDFIKLMAAINKKFSVLEEFDEEDRASVLEGLLSGSLKQSKAFVETHADTIAMAAAIQKNPGLAEAVSKQASRVQHEWGRGYAGNVSWQEYFARPELQKPE